MTTSSAADNLPVRQPVGALAEALNQRRQQHTMQASNSAPDIDEEGQRYLDVQRRAAAVQLYSRSLAIAHLRAQLVLPR